MGDPGIPRLLVRKLRTAFATPLALPAGETAAWTILCPALLAVALWNGFPLIFYDTGAYVLEGLGLHFLDERSPIYSLFLGLAGGGISLWFVVIFQSAASAFVIVESARCVAPRLSLGRFLLLSAALIIGTGLPWYVGEVEPDCFAAVSVLAFYLMVFKAKELGTSRSAAVTAVGIIAAATHSSHLLLVLGLLLCVFGYAVIRRLRSHLPTLPDADIVKPAAALAIAFGLVFAANFAFTGEMFLSRAGPSFLFARLLQDRVVIRLLDETCPASKYKLCRYRNQLPPTANAWLWAPYSPFFKLGGFEGTRAESARIVEDSLARYPLMNASAAGSDAVRQFFSFKTGDQVEPQQWALLGTFKAFLPSQVKGYLAARQQSTKIDFPWVNRVHVPLGYLSLAALTVALIFLAWRAEWETTTFLAFVLLALMGNAVICGALSNPHDRYQSRLIWLAMFGTSLAAEGYAASWVGAAARSATERLLVPAQILGARLRKRLAGTVRIRH